MELPPPAFLLGRHASTCVTLFPPEKDVKSANEGVNHALGEDGSSVHPRG